MFHYKTFFCLYKYITTNFTSINNIMYEYYSLNSDNLRHTKNMCFSELKFISCKMLKNVELSNTYSIIVILIT